MKILLTLTLLVFALFGANVDKFASEMGFERNYKVALQKAQKENKVLMMVLGADYCPWCRKFERQTLSADSIKKELDSKFITLVVDKKFDIESFPEEFQTQITPRVFFINPKSGASFYQTAGYIKRSEYSQKLQEAQRLFAKEQK